MTFNLLDSVKEFFSSDLVGRLTSHFGEGPGNITKALAGIVPAALGSIISRSSSDTGANSILQLSKETAGSGILDNPLGLLGEAGNKVRQLLGDKAGTIAGTISGFAGIKESSAASLMGLATSALLGILGKHVTENHLTAGNLSSLLSGQKSAVMAAMPAGLASLTNLTMPSVTSPTHTKLPSPTQNNNRWLWPLLLAVVVIFLVYLISRGCNKGVTSTVPMTDTTAALTPPIPAEAASIKVKLPDGTELDAYKGGIEDRLVTYLNSTDPADSVSKDRWFDFDQLNFKTASAEITDASARQVQNLSAILRAYPKLSIKIGGYTDKTGKEEENKVLSQQRADAVLTALNKAGAAGKQLAGAEGYGSQFARAAADAPDEERKLDRRISVSVRSK